MSGSETENYSKPILPGGGAPDYERYLSTDKHLYQLAESLIELTALSKADVSGGGERLRGGQD